MKLTDNISHTCRSCLEILQQFPFSNTSVNSSLESNAESASDNCDSTSVWADYDNIFASNQRNFKIVYINANNFGGLKFWEIKSWLLSRKYDFIVISETKIDASLPDSHVRVDGCRFCRHDREIGGGGLIIYVRSDIYFARVNKLDGISPENLVNFKTETIIIKIKLGNAWIAIVGVYRPPSIAKSIWINELSKLFEAGSMLADTIYYAGDL